MFCLIDKTNNVLLILYWIWKIDFDLSALNRPTFPCTDHPRPNNKEVAAVCQAMWHGVVTYIWAMVDPSLPSVTDSTYKFNLKSTEHLQTKSLTFILFYPLNKTHFSSLKCRADSQSCSNPFILIMFASKVSYNPTAIHSSGVALSESPKSGKSTQS